MVLYSPFKPLQKHLLNILINYNTMKKLILVAALTLAANSAFAEAPKAQAKAAAPVAAKTAEVKTTEAKTTEAKTTEVKAEVAAPVAKKRHSSRRSHVEAPKADAAAPAVDAAAKK